MLYEGEGVPRFCYGHPKSVVTYHLSVVHPREVDEAGKVCEAAQAFHLCSNVEVPAPACIHCAASLSLRFAVQQPLQAMLGTGAGSIPNGALPAAQRHQVGVTLLWVQWPPVHAPLPVG